MRRSNRTFEMEWGQLFQQNENAHIKTQYVLGLDDRLLGRHCNNIDNLLWLLWSELQNIMSMLLQSNTPCLRWIPVGRNYQNGQIDGKHVTDFFNIHIKQTLSGREKTAM